MTLQVHTARIGLVDPDVLDVTRKSGSELGKSFAPSWALLRPFLAWRASGLLGPEDWEKYVDSYTAEMRQSFTRRRDDWRELLARSRVVLVCYCTDPLQCHRTILARDILPRLGAAYGGELEGAPKPPTQREIFR